MEKGSRKSSSSTGSEKIELVADRKNGRTLFDRSKPSVGCSGNGRRRRKRRRRRRRRGRPRKRRKKEVERDLQVLGVRRWRELVADRKKWKDIVRQAKALIGL